MTFSFRRLRFTPTLIPTLAAMVAVMLTGYLGFWQQGRAAEKRGLQAEFDARAGEPQVKIGSDTRDPTLRYRQGIAEGEWLASAQIYIDNKVNHELVGYHVITPLKLAGSDSYLLVNRGWIARAPTYPVPPIVEVASGPVKISGQLSVPTTRFFELSPQSIQGKVWQNLTPERYRDAMRLDVLPFVLLAAETVPALQTVSERPDARAIKHTEYMLTWYSLAVTVIGLWIGLNISQATANLQDTTTVDAMDSGNRQGGEP